MTQHMKAVLATLGALILTVITSSCQSEKGTHLVSPPHFDEGAMRQAIELISQGYATLGESNTAGAKAKFIQAASVLPCKWILPSTSIMIYSSEGEADSILSCLERLANSGWDNPEVFMNGPHVALVQGDPRFAAVLDHFGENYVRATAVLANGIPDWNEVPDVHSDEELKTWIRQQDEVFNLQKNFWSASEELLAKIDLRMRILKAQRILAAQDSSFDYGLERLRLAYGLQPRDKMGWGSVSDMVRYESDRYSESVSEESKRQEAYYLAGSALSRKYSDDDPGRVQAYGEAANYLTRINRHNGNYRSAQALLIANKIKSADSSEIPLLINQLREIVQSHERDRVLYGEISSRLGCDIDKYLWPIPIDKSDIDDRKITLGQYRGKVLLIDFWAIWCSPCRASIPAMREAYDRFHKYGFEILSISLDERERTSLQDYRDWIKENGMNWQHIYDGDAWNSDLVERYFVARIPKALLVGPDGSLVAWGDDLYRDNLVETVKRAMKLLKK